MVNFLKNRGYVAVGLVTVGVALLIFTSGFYSGKHIQAQADQLANILNKSATSTTEVDFAPFWKAWMVINEKYIPTNSTTTEKVSDQKRLYGAISGMVNSLGDPYTMFFPPAESKSFNEEISGNFEGVGMEVAIKDNVLTVVSPIKGTPAYRAGIKTGDKVVKIDELLTNGLSTEEAISHIKGKKGTTVRLTIVREKVKEPMVLSIVRDVIDIPAIDTETRGDVFIIRLYSFSAISSNLFRSALRSFVESGKAKLIIDLRGNPGGYLDAAIDIASWFLPVGKVVVKEDFRNAEDTQVFRSKGYNIFSDKLRLVVLIDGGSASASEILAGALHENGVAILVGTQSFGKGSVQELVDITNDTSLKVTIARWLTPKGTSISHNGLTPDVIVKLDEAEFLKGNDTQLNKALEILNK
ncbi:MAG TPA: S41 family peptidase [Candidatus Paceibacterota bacterium]